MLKKMVDGVEMVMADDEEAELRAEWAANAAEQAQKDANVYLEDRKKAYPSIQDQLLYLWESMESGEIPTCKKFYDSIKSVNEKYPKPS